MKLLHVHTYKHMLSLQPFLFYRGVLVRCLCVWTLTFHDYKSLTSSTFLSYVSGGLCSEYITINQRNAAQAARLIVRERGSCTEVCALLSHITESLGVHPTSSGD